MKIILIRHGQTDWNVLQRYQGHKDIALNDQGRTQAEKIALYLQSHEMVEAIYSSDLSRSLETAVIISTVLKLPVLSDVRLKEISFGLWEGMTFTEVYEKYPLEFDNWFNNTQQVRVPGGESFDDVLHRSLQALNEIAARHTGTAVVVSHGGVIKAVLNHLNGGNGLWELGLEPCSMSYLEWKEGKFIPVEIGINL